MDQTERKTDSNALFGQSYNILFYKINLIISTSYPQAKHFLDSTSLFQYDGRVFPKDSVIDIMQSESQAKEVAENPALVDAVSSLFSPFHRT